MDMNLTKAISWMVLALAFYTYAVFNGRREGLTSKHLVVFGIGLLCDALGTHQMSMYAKLHGKAPELHNLSGLLSLGGMAFHFLLALLATLMHRAGAVNRAFHRVSLTIYSIWLMAFISGAYFGMRNLGR
jgi:uncharacterized repeat protein (TIGR03987 family)